VQRCLIPFGSLNRHEPVSEWVWPGAIFLMRMPDTILQKLGEQTQFKGGIDMSRAARDLSTRCVRLLTAQLLACRLTVFVAAERPEAGNGMLAGEVADAVEDAPISSPFVLVHRSGAQRIWWSGLNLQEGSKFLSRPADTIYSLLPMASFPPAKWWKLLLIRLPGSRRGYAPTLNMPNRARTDG
jgi:hypothetical protein